jgi:hypothetical protein
LIIYLFISVSIVISIIFLIYRYVFRTHSDNSYRKSRSVLQSNTLDFIDIELLNE